MREKKSKSIPAPVSTSLASNLNQVLFDRATMLAHTRNFFAERGILEVDTPLLQRAAPIDTHIDVMQVQVTSRQIGYLHTSPEYALKRLLAEGIGDLYQLGHVFRSGEIGPLHSPEFTMIEWYRTELPYEAFMEEVLDLLKLFLGPLSVEKLTYYDALQKYTGLDARESSLVELYECAVAHELGISPEAKHWEQDALLNLLFSFLVEPHLGKNGYTVIHSYPPSQAALAKIEGRTARRFEIYVKGIELANGYDELIDANEQRKRLVLANRQRLSLGKDSLPIDEEFLAALEKGLPNCCGVAVGFDRLMLLRQGAHTLAEVLPIFPAFFSAEDREL